MLLGRLRDRGTRTEKLLLRVLCVLRKTLVVLKNFRHDTK
jgi:hypothetical protein